jgi:hypothetical protein
MIGLVFDAQRSWIFTILQVILDDLILFFLSCTKFKVPLFVLFPLELPAEKSDECRYQQHTDDEHDRVELTAANSISTLVPKTACEEIDQDGDGEGETQRKTEPKPIGWLFMPFPVLFPPGHECFFV